MAEEGTLGLPRASIEHDDDEVPSKQELQRRMEEARETITQTVTEIKETVTNQYYSMKETVSDALDWRHHFRKNPIAFSIGALSVGALVGYGLTGTVKGGRRDERDYPSADESDIYARTGAMPLRYEDAPDALDRQSAFHGHSYASQPITDQSYEAPDYGRREYEGPLDGEERDYDRSPSPSLSYSAGARSEREETPEKPGILERFKGTPVYDRLQTEVATLGDRFIEELSTTAQTVVLPALFNKIKELFGVDLSDKQDARSRGEQSASSSSQSGAGARAASASAAGGASPGSGSRGSTGSSYGTSENRGYGAQASARETDRSGEASSVLDLER